MRLLIVDDDRALRDALRGALNLAGYQVTGVRAGLEALGEVTDQPPDAVILDIGLPDVSGLDVCRLLRARGQRLLGEPEVALGAGSHPLRGVAVQLRGVDPI